MRWLIVVALACAAPARADDERLAPLPTEIVQSLAPLLRDRDIVLLQAGQIAALTLVRAPPALVREVVIQPGRYPEFVRNMKRSRVAAEPQGTLWHEYAISYGVYTVEGRHRYRYLPPEAGQAAPVLMDDADPNPARHFRWAFVAAGGATVLVLYGRVRIPQDGFTRRYIDAAPTLESGFALIPHLTLLYSMKGRAETLASPAVMLPTGPEPSLQPLLMRGTVALLRSTGNHPREVTIVERSSAPPAAFLTLAASPSRWPALVPTFKSAGPLPPRDGLPAVDIVQELPYMSWATSFCWRSGEAAVDFIGVDGDLRDGRLRFEAWRDDVGTQVALQMAASFAKGSLLLRQVYKLEPYLEYGFDVAIAELLLRGLRVAAERVP